MGVLSAAPSYSWLVVGGQIITSGNNYIVVHWNAAGEGEVSVSTPGCGAMYSAFKTVAISGSRQPDMPAVTRNCGSTMLTRGTPPMEITWYWQTSPQGKSRDNAGATYTCTASTTIYLRAYDGNSGCWSPATSIPVTVSQAPDFTLVICQGSSAQLSARGSNDIAYSWSPATGLSDPHIANPWASPAQTTNYTVTGTLNGCSTARQVTVEVAPAFEAAISSHTGADLSTVLQASNRTNQPATYSWSWPGSGGSFTGPVIAVKPRTITTFTLTATQTGLGCVSTATITVEGQNHNYITTSTILEAGQKTAAGLAALRKEQRTQSTTYFDGLGRDMQTVLTQGSPSGKDVVQPLGYDAYGRQDRKYLPYVDAAAANGFYKPDANKTPDAYQSSDQYLFYQAATAGPGKHARDGAPFAQTIFEASPLNRVLEQGSPGAAFQPGTGRTVKFAEKTNAAGQVRLWECSGGSFSSPGFYEANELYVTETRDEHDNPSLVFTDKQGKVVLKQVHDGQDLLSTYYIFDELDNLRLVVQPEGAKRIAGGPFAPDATFIAAWCFRYSYDGRRRLIEKQVPTAGPVYLVYDQRDRLVLSQDAVQRESQQWTYTRYDALNRPAETGLYRPGEDLDQSRMQARLDAFITSRPGNQNNADPASATSFPDDTDQTEALTYTYYDDYSPELLSGKAFVAEIGLSDDAHSSNTYANRSRQVRGQVTGSQIKVLGSNTWLTTVNYYNAKNQLIQAISDNQVGGTDRITSRYDFAGRLLETLLTQTTGAGQYLVHNQFSYDHGSRLLETRQRTGTDAAALLSQPQVLIAFRRYNELGQLVEKGLHATGDAPTPPLQRKYLQSLDYRYHIRGWLTHINNADLSIDSQNNDEADDVFGLELTYDKPDAAAPGRAGSSAQAYFNGNISQAIWKTQSPDGASYQRAYCYNYDGLSRLLEAQYGSQNTAEGEDFSL